MNSPTGTITFLFTDIEGSTRLWEEQTDTMRLALACHDTLLRAAIETNGGTVFKTIGDAFCAAFPTAPQGVEAALSAQQSLHQVKAGVGSDLRFKVRMALHTGTAEQRDADYFGPSLNRTARLISIGHGGQVLLSQTTYDLSGPALPTQVSVKDLGQHRLKDLLAPEHVWQLLHPDLPAEFPPLRSLDPLATNLPRQVSSFIGRQRETAEVKDLLLSTALLTLTGAGGCGKTRLSLQVAADVLEDYKDGVWLVELGALSEASLVPQTVASVLGLREEPGRPLIDTLTDFLRDRRLLLLLDNCEHLVSACARLVDTLLKSCPHLRILATSREPLNIPFEQPWRVPSLLQPDPQNLPREEKDLPAVLLDYDAVRLFVERARVQQPRFVLTRQNASAVASVCHQLDGIPLALELAAARIRAMSVEQILSRLDDRFNLLTGGSRTTLPRQQTLRGLMDWSYDLLQETEQALLMRLSVFSGGWTLEAAEAVCSDECGGMRDESSAQTYHSSCIIHYYEVLDLLTSLVDKSLVVYEQQEQAGRYRLLESVREYAREKLRAAGEEKRLLRQHLDYFLMVAEQVRQKLAGQEQAHWLEALEREHDNLRQALSICQEAEEGGETGLRLGAALPRFWRTRGHLSEGRGRLAALLSHPRAQQPTQARADALDGAGGLARVQGDYISALTLHEQSLEIFRELGNRQGVASCLNNLGNVVLDQGDYVLARSRYEECLAIWREIDNRPGIASSLGNLGNLAFHQGDYASAHTLLEQSLAIKRELGDKWSIALTLQHLGNLAYHQNDYAVARSLYEESLAIWRELGDRWGIAYSFGNLGLLAYREGDYASARTLFEEILAIQRELGDRWGISQSLLDLGNVASAEGDYASARPLYRQSLAIRREMGDKQGIAWVLEAIASLNVKEDKREQAVPLWAAAQRLREEISAPLPPNEREDYDHDVASTRQTLGAEAFSAAWAEGRAKTLEQALSYALDKGG